MIKKTLFIIFFLFVICSTINAQSSSDNTRRIWSGTADPAICQPSGTNIFYRSDTGTLKICTSTNTWTPLASGSSAITGSGTTNIIPLFTGANSIGNSPFSYSGSSSTLQTTGLADFNILSGSGEYQIGASADNFIKISKVGLNQWHVNPNDLMLDTTTGRVQIGDAQGGGNNTQLDLSDLDGHIKLRSITGTISIGDTEGEANNVRVTVSDTSQTINITSLGNIRLGDTDGLGSNSLVSINDTTQVASIVSNTITLNGNLTLNKTITPSGTVGARTINKTTGTVNFAAAATSLVVTNSLVSTSSIIICTVGTNDTTFKSAQCVAGSGSFTIFANAAATAETRVNFVVTN